MKCLCNTHRIVGYVTLRGVVLDSLLARLTSCSRAPSLPRSFARLARAATGAGAGRAVVGGLGCDIAPTDLPRWYSFYMTSMLINIVV